MVVRLAPVGLIPGNAVTTFIVYHIHTLRITVNIYVTHRNPFCTYFTSVCGPSVRFELAPKVVEHWYQWSHAAALEGLPG